MIVLIRRRERVWFQSTPPARGATMTQSAKLTGPLFQSTPPARGATGARRQARKLIAVSIHAPRAGGDYSKRYQR